MQFSSGGSKRGRKGRTPHPPGPNFFHFHAVFGKIGQIVYWRPSVWDWHTPLWEILDLPLFSIFIWYQQVWKLYTTALNDKLLKQKAGIVSAKCVEKGLTIAQPSLHITAVHILPFPVRIVIKYLAIH